MNPSEVIQKIACRARVTEATPDAVIWEFVASEFQKVTGTPFKRANPYHIAIAAAAYRTIRPDNLS